MYEFFSQSVDENILFLLFLAVTFNFYSDPIAFLVTFQTVRIPISDDFVLIRINPTFNKTL